MSRIKLALLVGMAAVTIAWVASPAAAQLTPPNGATNSFFNTDANLDTDGNNRWESTGNYTAFDLLPDNSPAVTRGTFSPTAAVPGIAAAYDYPGGSTGNQAGTLLTIAGTSTQRSFQEASGDWSNEDVTIEIWFRPDNLTPTPTNGQILFEDGGGTGFGFFVDNNELRLRKAPGGGNVAYNISTDPSGLLVGAATAEFIQAVGTYDVSAGSMELFVNGQSVGTAAPTGADWSGGDAAGVGTRGDSNVGGIGNGQQSTETFDGEIAVFRVYRNKILTGGLTGEVMKNFQAVTATDVYSADSDDSGGWAEGTSWNTGLTPTAGQNGWIGDGDTITLSGPGRGAKALTVGHAEATNPGTGTLTVTSGGLSVVNDLTIGDGNAGTVNLNGGTTTVGGNIVNGASTSTLTLDGGTVDMTDGTLDVDTLNLRSGTLKNVSEINGGAAVSKTTGGTLTLDGTNNYSGNTNINAGTVRLGASEVIPHGAGKGNVNVDGTLDLAAKNETINGLSGSGTVTNRGGPSAVLTVGANDASSTFSGTLTDEIWMQAGTVQTDETWSPVTFAEPFSSTPVVLVQTTTRNDGAAVTERLQNVTANGFQVRLQEEEGSTDGGDHAIETISWIAIAPGTGVSSGWQYEADLEAGVTNADANIAFSPGFGASPVFLASAQTFADSDPIAIRSRSLNATGATIFLEEEASLDTERVHSAESVGYLAADAGSTPFGELGTSNTTHVWKTVNLSGTYSNPVVVMGPPTIAGGDPSTVRVQAVNPTLGTFQWQVDEWDYRDVNHANETAGYMVVEAGMYGMLGLTKTGSGTLTLSGNNDYRGPTNVSDGTLIVDGSIASSRGVTVDAGAILGGHGIVPGISGAGLVSPGNSEEILTALNVDPSSGLDFVFDYGATGSPDYGTPDNSINDVLRLTDASPFVSALGAANTVGIYLDLTDIAQNDVFLGGFFTDQESDFYSSVVNADWEFYIFGDGSGSHLHPVDGTNFYPLSEFDPLMSLQISTVAQTADFTGGDEPGRVLQLRAFVPEPSTMLIWSLLAGLGIGMGWRRGK